jgi:uncharacterized protein
MTVTPEPTTAVTLRSHAMPEVLAVQRSGPRARNVTFTYNSDIDLIWTSKPEFAIAANSVSLLMPFVEPYVVRSIRHVIDEIEDQGLAGEAKDFVRQESQHHAQHRNFNRLLTARFRGLTRIEGWIDSSYKFVERHTSKQFGVGFAAGFETVAFCAARWVDMRADDVLFNADPQVASLYLWHLAEEVEHKTVAHDVYRAIGGKRLQYAAAMLLSAVMLAWFAVLGTLTMLWSERRIFNPVAHLRLLLWTLTFLFVLLPVMAVSVLPAHDPRDLADPYRLHSWVTGTFDGVDSMGVRTNSL